MCAAMSNKESILIVYPCSLLLLPLYVAIASPIYFAIFESSRYQASPGKLLFGLSVVDSQGGRVSIAKAFLRVILKGLIPVAFTYNMALRQLFRDKRSLLESYFLSVIEPIFDDANGVFVIDRRALKPTHKLQLSSKLETLCNSVERGHQVGKIAKAITTANLAFTILYALLTLWAAFGMIMTPFQRCTFLIFSGNVFAGFLAWSALHFYFQTKITRLRNRMLQTRQSQQTNSSDPRLEDKNHA
jgi:uncharacterized RDD family membrane protein YckC